MEKKEDTLRELYNGVRGCVEREEERENMREHGKHGKIATKQLQNATVHLVPP